MDDIAQIKPKVNLFLQPAVEDEEEEEQLQYSVVTQPTNPVQQVLNPKTIFTSLVLPMVGAIILTEAARIGLYVLAKKLSGEK